MACGYDTQRVLEMLFDIDWKVNRDMLDGPMNFGTSINSDSIHGNLNRDSSCSDSCVYELRKYMFTFQFIRKVR